MAGGLFISFEGGEGSGKSTQIHLLEQAFSQGGHSVLCTREPGGTPGAEEIRALLVQGGAERWDDQTETLLFFAARLDHVNRFIRPALMKGKIILCDRFTDSTMVYQGIGKQVDMHFIERLNSLLLQNFLPDLTFILDISPEQGLARTRGRQNQENRFEAMNIEFHKRIRQGFLETAQRNRQRCVLIDASQLAQQVHASIIETINLRLKLALRPLAMGVA